MTDDALVQAYLEGKVETFDELLARHQIGCFKTFYMLYMTKIWPMTSSKRHLSRLFFRCDKEDMWNKGSFMRGFPVLPTT